VSNVKNDNLVALYRVIDNIRKPTERKLTHALDISLPSHMGEFAQLSNQFVNARYDRSGRNNTVICNVGKNLVDFTECGFSKPHPHER
jgi:hypothetical protein